MIDKVFRNGIEQENNEFYNMATYLVNGLWCMEPFLNTNVLLNYLYNVLQQNRNNNENSRKFYRKMNRTEYFLYNFITFIFQNLVYRYYIFKIVFNSLRRFSLWLMKVCPFLAYYQFGVKNSYVNINN